MLQPGQPLLPLQAASDVARDEERGHLAGVQVVKVLLEELWEGERAGRERERERQQNPFINCKHRTKGGRLAGAQVVKVLLEELWGGRSGGRRGRQRSEDRQQRPLNFK